MMKLSSYKGLTGHWSKYGGTRSSLVDNQKETTRVEWFCQTCGEKQPIDLSPFKVQIREIEEYIRICAVCFYRVSCEPSISID